MGTTVKYPKQDYAQQTRDTLATQIQLMPDLFKAESEFQPQFAQLQMDIANQMTPQLLDLYGQTQPRLAEMDAAALANQREADISAVEQLGPRAYEAMQNLDPQRAALLDSLMADAQTGLDSGGELTGIQRRNYQQNVRGAQAARGMGMGPSDALYEAAELQLGQERRQQQSRADAMKALTMQQALMGDPFMQILGKPSGTSPMMAAQTAAAGGGMSPGQLFNPESQYAQSLYNNNAMGTLQARMATSANRMGLIGAGIGAVGDMASAGITRCWVAREVFGESNPKWMAFYVWKEEVGPRWFKAIYNRYGEWFAKLIRNRPTVKNIIRNWMETRLNRLNKG